MTTKVETVGEQAAAALGAWEQFVAEWKALGEMVRREDPWLYRRVDAYPGWDGLRDVGSGQSMEQWIEEVGGSAMVAMEEEPLREEPCVHGHVDCADWEGGPCSDENR